MAFLAGGHLPGRGEYGPVVERTLNFVLSCGQDDGYITYAGTRMYSHAFATLFLAEIYGMTHREDVQATSCRLADRLRRSTRRTKKAAGATSPTARESDMSIVVCQVLALRAARNIGIRVPKSIIDKRRAVCRRFGCDQAEPVAATTRRASNYGNEIGSFHYQKQDVHSRSSFPLTAAGVTALYGIGIYSDESDSASGLDYLKRRTWTSFNRDWGSASRAPGTTSSGTATTTPCRPCTRPAARSGSATSDELRDVLLSMQRADGSWPNSVGPGEAFGTAMAVLMLEIPYRFLPIFQR